MHAGLPLQSQWEIYKQVIISVLKFNEKNNFLDHFCSVIYLCSRKDSLAGRAQGHLFSVTRQIDLEEWEKSEFIKVKT
jgi:hypothetical protein